MYVYFEQFDFDRPNALIHNIFCSLTAMAAVPIYCFQIVLGSLPCKISNYTSYIIKKEQSRLSTSHLHSEILLPKFRKRNMIAFLTLTLPKHNMQGILSFPEPQSMYVQDTLKLDTSTQLSCSTHDMQAYEKQ